MCSTKVWTEFSSRPSEGSSRIQIRFSDPYAGMSPCNTAKRRYKPPERWHTRSCFLCCKFHAVSRLSGSEIPPQFAANSILSPTSSSPLIPPDCRVNPNGFARLTDPDWRGMIPAIDSINVECLQTRYGCLYAPLTPLPEVVPHPLESCIGLEPCGEEVKHSFVLTQP